MALGIVLAWLYTLGMAALGVVACAAPAFASWMYGVPQDDPAGHAWVRAAGLRDLGLCVVLGWGLATSACDAVAVAALATGLVAAADAVNVLARRGLAVPGALLVHASGVAGGGLIAALLAGG